MLDAIPYHRLFEDFSVTPDDDAPSPRGLQQRHWSSSIGCLVQTSDVYADCEISAQAVVKPSLFINLMLDACDGTRCSLTNVPGADGRKVESAAHVDQFINEFMQPRGVPAAFETPKQRSDFGPTYYQVMFVDPQGLAIEVFCA